MSAALLGGPWGLAAYGAMSFLPALFGGAARRSDPLLGARSAVMRELSPDALGSVTNSLFSQWQNSPAYWQAWKSAVGASQGLQNQVGHSLAARGIGTSGIGAVAPALAGSSLGFNLGNISAAGYQMAAQNAARLQQARAEALLSGGQVPNYTNNLLAGGINSFMPLLAYYLMNGRQGGASGGGGLGQQTFWGGPRLTVPQAY